MIDPQVRFLEYVVVRAIVGALQAMPAGACRGLTRLLARAAFALDLRHRLRTVDHLRHALGDSLRDGQAEKLARGVFDHLGRHVADFLRAARGEPSPVRIENAEVLHRAQAQGRGVVAVSAHLGSFTLLGRVARQLGYPTAVIFKRQKNARLLDWLNAVLRKEFGIEIVLKPDAPSRVPELLRQGFIVVLFADQHPTAGGVEATFFGRPIEAAIGPAIFARRSRAPLIVVTLALGPDGAHVARFEGPVSTEGSIGEISQRWLDLLEARIREHPEQWMWTHRRWR